MPDTPKIFVGNDHLVQLLGLQNATNLGYINDATVSVRLLDAIGGTLITGGGPVVMAAVAAGDVGGTGSDTVVKRVANAGARSVQVTVGATNPLALSAGDWVHFHGHDRAYRISTAAAGAAGAAVTLFLESRLRSRVETGEPVFALGGVYQGVLEDTVSIETGKSYVAEITIDATTEDIQAVINLPVVADDRE